MRRVDVYVEGVLYVRSSVIPSICSECLTQTLVDLRWTRELPVHYAWDEWTAIAGSVGFSIPESCDHSDPP